MAELVQRLALGETLKSMDVGETVGFACDIMSSGNIRSMASFIGIQLDRKYSVHLNRENRTYEVTRNE